MQKHHAQPAEGLRYRVAGFWRRGLAALADGLVLLPLVMLFGSATAAIAGQQLPRLGELGFAYAVHLAVDGGLSGAIALAAAGATVLLYELIFLATSGQTPGMRLFGLRVVGPYGDPPSVPRAMLRIAGLIVSIAIFNLGCLWIGFSREKRGLHDLIAGTWVVRGAPLALPVAEHNKPSAGLGRAIGAPAP